MEGQTTTAASSSDYSKNDNPGYNYPAQPGPYYNENPAQHPYYHENPAQHPYYQPNAPTYNTGYTNNATVVIAQPAPSVTQVVQIQDNMGLAIFACLCCFWPLGLVAILRANESRDALARGDVNDARQSASDARKFSLISIGVGVGLSIIAIIVTIIIVVTASSTTSYSSYSSYNG